MALTATRITEKGLRHYARVENDNVQPTLAAEESVSEGSN
jgi:hypothetical protein